jgi:hypothetical protein
MSKTPETDSNCWREGTSEWVAANFARKLERERDEARREQSSIQCAFEDTMDKIEELERERDTYHGAVALIAEDCEAWLNSESDEPSCDFIKLVAKYAREALQ